VLQTGVQHFLDSAEFGAPQIAHVVETLVDGVEAGFNSGKLAFELAVESAELCIHEGNDQPDQSGIEQHRNPDGQVKLLVRHHEKVRSVRHYALTNTRLVLDIGPQALA
jgi:hypothetical protein